MTFSTCYKCNRYFQTIRELNQHISKCEMFNFNINEINSTTKIFDTSKIFEIKIVTIVEIQNENSMNQKNEYIKIFSDDDVDDDETFIIFERTRSNIFNSVFAFKITTFEKKIDRKTEICALMKKKIKITNNSNNIKTESYHSFNNSTDFALTL